MFVQIGPFVAKIGYDKKLDSYYGWVYDGSINQMSSKPFLQVGTSMREIKTTQQLRNELRDDVLHYGLELTPICLRELEEQRTRALLRKANVASGAEAH